MLAGKALNQLGLSKKHAAKPVSKLLKSAMANAVHNDNVDASTLVVKRAFVDGGPILYRWMPRAFGRASKIRKRTSHITLILEGEAKEAAAKSKKKESKDTSDKEKTKKEATTDQKEEKPKTEKKSTKKPAAKKTTAKKKTAPKKKTEDKK